MSLTEREIRLIAATVDALSETNNLDDIAFKDLSYNERNKLMKRVEELME